jgi:hypothetical protein
MPPPYPPHEGDGTQSGLPLTRAQNLGTPMLLPTMRGQSRLHEEHDAPVFAVVIAGVGEADVVVVIAMSAVVASWVRSLENCMLRMGDGGGDGDYAP